MPVGRMFYCYIQYKLHLIYETDIQADRKKVDIIVTMKARITTAITTIKIVMYRWAGVLELNIDAQDSSHKALANSVSVLLSVRRIKLKKKKKKKKKKERKQQKKNKKEMKNNKTRTKR